MPVAKVLEVFNQRFADRAELSRRTGWPTQVYDTIDVYRDSAMTLSFPPRRLLSELFGHYAASVRYIGLTLFIAISSLPIFTKPTTNAYVF